jgi:hypothetical protein
LSTSQKRRWQRSPTGICVSLWALRKKYDEDGFPLYDKRFCLRIDLDTRIGFHIHYMKENHIPASRITGLDPSITPSKFIKAVESHRASRKPFDEILGFKVVSAS